MLLQLWDQHGAEVSSKICKIIGADGGFAQKAKNWPVEGMLTDVAYRWDVVRLCSAQFTCCICWPCSGYCSHH